MNKLNPKNFGKVEYILAVVLVCILIGVGWYVWSRNQTTKKLNAISNFAQCKADAGSLIQETYPEVCVTKNGRRFPNPEQKAQEITIATKSKCDSYLKNKSEVVRKHVTFLSYDEANQIIRYKLDSGKIESLGWCLPLMIRDVTGDLISIDQVKPDKEIYLIYDDSGVLSIFTL